MSQKLSIMSSLDGAGNIGFERTDAPMIHVVVKAKPGEAFTTAQVEDHFASCEVCRAHGVTIEHFRALMEAHEQPARGVRVSDFLTAAQIDECVRLFDGRGIEAVGDIERRVIAPNLPAINAKLGQENDARYLAYAVVNALLAALERSCS